MQNMEPYIECSYMYEFGNMLKKLRLAKNLTQEQLANVIEIAPSSIAMYERGTRTPSLKMLVRLSQYFNVSINELLNAPIKNKSINASFLNITLDEFNALSVSQKQSIINFIEFIKKQNT